MFEYRGHNRKGAPTNAGQWAPTGASPAVETSPLRPPVWNQFPVRRHEATRVGLTEPVASRTGPGPTVGSVDVVFRITTLFVSGPV
jgi:hypothetical protein